MYSLTKPMTTVVLSMDAIRLESSEENADVASSPVLGSEDRDETDEEEIDAGSLVRDEPDVTVVGSTPGSILTVTSSRDFEGPTD